jgi:ornithine carbamoyltransferase
MTTIMRQHFLKVSDLNFRELEYVLELAEDMKRSPNAWITSLRGRTVASLFDKPSTRTRVSFAAAAHRLGMLPLELRPDELQLGRGETIEDTARTLSGYCAAITIRTFEQRRVEELAAAATIPVINALTDEHHPCQALADVLTITERLGRFEGVRVAFVGDGNNVANSLAEIGALLGFDVVVASPRGFRPSVECAHVVEDPREAVADADVVYTDVWASMGEEDEHDERLLAFGRYQVTTELMGRAKPGAIFMHCLPAHRGEEVDADVIDGPKSAVWQQAANRLPTEQALLYALCTGEWS